jgi:hypothetical protein
MWMIFLKARCTTNWRNSSKFTPILPSFVAIVNVIGIPTDSGHLQNEMSMRKCMQSPSAALTRPANFGLEDSPVKRDY